MNQRKPELTKLEETTMKESSIDEKPDSIHSDSLKAVEGYLTDYKGRRP